MGPPPPSRGTLVCQVEAVDRTCGRAPGSRRGNGHSQLPALQPTWGPREPKKQGRVMGAPRRIAPILGQVHGITVFNDL